MNQEPTVYIYEGIYELGTYLYLSIEDIYELGTYCLFIYEEISELGTSSIDPQKIFMNQEPVV